MENYLAVLRPIWEKIHLPTLEFLVGVLTIAIVWIRIRRRFRPIKTSGTETGDLYVSQKALIKSVVGVGSELGLPTLLKVKIQHSGQHLHLKVYIKLAHNQSFGELSAVLQDRIRQNLIQYLGLEKEIRVDVVLSGIQSPPERENPSSPER
ncbi:MAG: hypothetical protein LBR62_01720 [Puniceicoccales bacterium]|jgi:uncharacterized alkaline shock family protein YloU|nr:hypothetical protein [Puniceicoccales bacterium]